VHAIYQIYFGGLSIPISSGEPIRKATFIDQVIRGSLLQ
jgi:hypothetical protein